MGGEMAGYLITGVISFAAGYVLWLIQRERRSLVYVLEESALFPQGGSEGRYFTCNIRNLGNKELENISFKFSPRSGVLASVKYSDPTRFRPTLQQAEELTGVIPLLNPQESVEIILTISNASTYTSLSVEVRTIGVTAVQAKVYQEGIATVLNTSLAVMIGTGVVMGYLIYSDHQRSKITSKFTSELKSGAEDILKGAVLTFEKDGKKAYLTNESDYESSDQIIMTILNESGIGRIFGRLADAGGTNITYWRTGVFIGRAYAGDKKNASKFLAALSRLQKEEGVASTSKAFLNYIAAKISQSEGNATQSFNYLEQCKKVSPAACQRLLDKDQYFDLNHFQGATK